MLYAVFFLLIQLYISQLSALAMTIRLLIQRQSLRFSTVPPRRSRFFVSFWIEVENQQSTSAEEIPFNTNLRYPRPACDKLELLKSANSVCTPFGCPLSWRSHFFVVQPESDNSQKTCSQFENPISTVWVFLLVYIQRLVSHT